MLDFWVCGAVGLEGSRSQEILDMTWINCTGFLEIGRRVIRIRYLTFSFRRFGRIILSVVFYMFRCWNSSFPHCVDKSTGTLPLSRPKFLDDETSRS